MLKMRTKEASAPAYVPSPLVRPNLDEVRNGWTAESLTQYLRNAAEHEVSFAQERLVRARHRAQQAAKAVDQFRKTENLRETGAARALQRLERLAMEAHADAIHAEALFDCAQEEAA
jgi:predicted TPR repeat methyltransferase